MRPAFSVIFFTTLAGMAQGLLLALFSAEWATRHLWAEGALPTEFYVLGALVAAVLAIFGLAASFLHLGHPEKAWRAVMQWRTSWLSREVIVLPGFIALTLAYAAAVQWFPAWRFLLCILAAFAAIGLFVCTGMIYACIKFLREWASPLTLVNFMLLGCAAGFTLAAALAAFLEPSLQQWFAVGAVGFTLLALIGRVAAWQRNARLVPKSTVQSAIGIKHRRIEQKSQGFMGGSFNTKEFFHGRTAALLRALRWGCVLLGFVVPLLLVAGSLAWPLAAVFLAVAVIAQYLGQLAERWLFFAEANHPQNLYYQRMA